MKRTLAIDIGGTNFSVGVFRGEKMLGKTTRETDRLAGPYWMLDKMQEMVSELVAESDFDACGIGFGGPVHFDSQQILFSTQVPGWEEFDLIKEVESRFKAPAIVDRDSMVGALGEGMYGAGIGKRPMFYITLSTGVGGGLLTERGLYHGHDSYACELGHHTVLTNGPVCLCGSFGCMERMCSGLWLERDYGQSAKELLQSPEFVNQYVVYLAQGLKNTIMFLNPELIVIGGGISKAGDALFLPLRKELGRQMTSWSKATIEVVPAALRGESVLWGAMQLANEYIHATGKGNEDLQNAKVNARIDLPPKGDACMEPTERAK